MMERLTKNQLADEDHSYLRYYYEWESIKGSVASQSKQEGLQEGLEKGQQIGLRKGEQIGRQGEKISIALSALEQGLDIETITTFTGLSVEEIRQLTLSPNNKVQENK